MHTSLLATLRRHRRTIGVFLVALLAYWQTGQPLQAAILSWNPNGDGTAGGGAWNTSNTLWNNGGAVSWNNATPDSAVFGGSSGTGPFTVTLGEAITAGSLTFNTGGFTGNYVIDTSTFGLTLNTGITANESATIQSGVGGSLILGANNTWSVASGKTLTVSSAVTGSGFGLTKSGIGTLLLSGANGYSGATTLNGGTLTLDYATQNNSKLSDSAGLNLNGGTLSLTGGSHVEEVASVSLGAGGTTISQLTPGSTLRMNAITRSVGGTLNFGAASIASTDTLNDAGGILGTWATVGGTDWAINSINGADGAITAFSSYVNDTWAAGSNITVTGNSAQASGSTAHSLRFNAAAPATVTLAGTNTITSGGILVTSAVGANATSITGGILQGSAGGDLIVHQNNTGAAFTISSVIQNNTTATGLTKTGNGQLTLTNINTYTGATTLNAGTLRAEGNASALGTGPLILNGGILQLANDGALILGNNTTVAGNVTIVADRLTPSATSTTHTLGTLTIGAHTLTTQRGANITDTSTGNITFNGTTLTGNATFTAGTRNTLTLGAVTESGGSYSLTVNGSGTNPTVTVSGTGGWSGGTVLNSGTLRVSSANGLGTAGSLTTVNGGILRLDNASSAASRNVTFTATGELALTNSNNTTWNIGTLAQTAGTLTIVAQRASTGTGNITHILNENIELNGNLTLEAANSTSPQVTTLRFQGTISDALGTGVLRKIGAGVVILEAAASHGGTTRVSTGTLRLGLANALPFGSGKGNLVIDPTTNATLDLNGFNQTLNGISSSGAGTSVIDNTAVGPVTLTIGANNGTGTFAGTIQDTGGNLSLVKTGSGLITLNGTGAYAGSTSVDGGTLSVTPGAIAATSTLNVGTGGSGTLSLVADNVAALLTLANNTNLNLGGALTSGTLLFQLGANTTSSDRMALQGTGLLTIGAGGGYISGLDIGGFTAGSYDLVTGPNAIVGLGNIALGQLPGGYTYTLTEPSSGTLRLTVAAVGAGDLFWTGDLNSSWTTALANTNWSTTQGSNTESNFTPGSLTTVNFSAAGAANFSTTLDQNYSVAGINVLNGGSAVSIAPGAGGTLTIGAGGINVQTGAPASTTISAPVTATGSQTWAVADSGTLLEVNAGVNASGDLTKSGAGILQLGTVASTVTGRLDMTGTLRLAGGNLTVGSLAGSGILENASGTTDVTLTVGADNTTSTFNGTMQNGGTGNLGITKVGTGVLTLSGNGTYTGITKVDGGILRVSGTLNNGASDTDIAETAGATAMVHVTSTGSITTDEIDIGNQLSGVGSLVIAGGSVAGTSAGTNDGILIGASTSGAGYGGIFMSSGSLSARRLDMGANGAGLATAVVQLSGGSFNWSEYLLARAGKWELTLAGANASRTGTGNVLGLGQGTGSGALTITTGVLDNAGQTIVFGRSGTGGTSSKAVLNLNGGTVTTNAFTITPANFATGSAHINFDGGTLRANIDSTAFLPTGLTGVFVNDGGAVIDTNSRNITIAASFLSPSGNGVTSIPVSTPGSGYIGAPYVEITGGGGTGATGSATVDLNPLSGTFGQIIGITITNPGNGYTSAPTINLIGGLGTGGTAGTVGVATTAANTSGGLTKTGNGTLTLSGANTFTGPTVVNGGTLSVAPTSLSTTSSLHVGATGNGSFDLYQDGTGAAFNMATNANLILGSATTWGALGFDLGSSSDSIVLSGSGAMTVNAGGGIINAKALSGFGVGSYDLVTGPNSIVGGLNLSLGTMPSGYGYALDYTTDPTKLVLNVSAAAAGDVWWRGDVNGSWANFNGGNTNWATTSDGSTEAGFIPGASNVIRFSATNAGAGAINTTLDNALSIQGLKILNSGTGSVTIAPGSGGSLTIGTDGIEVLSGAPASTTISAPVTLGASQTWSVATGNTLAISGVVSGGNNLQVSGGGTVSLSGTNTFTGNVVVDGAGSRLGFSSAAGLNIGVDGAQTYTVQNGGIISLTGAATANPTAASSKSFVVGAGGGTIDVADSAGIIQLDDPGQFSGTGAMTKAGSGLLILGANSTTFTSYTGTQVTVSGGELRLQNAQALGASGSQAAVLLETGSILHLRQSTGSNFGSNLTLNGRASLIVNRQSNGAGTNHSLGTLAVGTHTFTVQAGSSVTSGTMGAVFGVTTLSGSAIFDLINSAGGTAQLTLGNISETGSGRSLTKSGSGQLYITGASSFTGGIIVHDGILRGVGASPAGTPTTDPFGSNTITLNGGQLQVRDDGNGAAGAQTLTYDNPIAVNASATINVDRISGSADSKVIRFGRLTISNGATLTTTDDNGYDVFFNSTSGNISTLFSNTTISVASGMVTSLGYNGVTNSGTGVALTDGASSFGLIKTGSGTLVLGRTQIDGILEVNGGTLQLNLNNNSLLGGIVVTSGTLLANDSNGVFGAASSPDVKVNGGIVDLRSGSSAQTVGLDFLGNATLALRNSTGGTTFSVESLDIAATATQFTLNGNRASGSGAIAGHRFNGPITTNGSLVFNVTGNANVNELFITSTSSIGLGGNITFNPTTANLTVEASIADGAGSYSLTKTGAGILTLPGVNAYDGPTAIEGGSVVIGADSGLGNAPGAATPGHLTLNNGALSTSGTFELNANRGLALNGPGGQINVVSGTLTYAGASAGAGGLQKAGVGTLVLSGTSGYSGGTLVSAGTLKFGKQVSLYNNTTASWTDTNLIVESGATAAFNVGGTGEFTTSDIDILKGLGTATGGFKSGSVIGFDTTNASGGTFTYSGTIADPNGGSNVLGLTKLGTNNLVLDGPNSFTGAVSVMGGTLIAAHNTALGTSAGGVTVSPGGTLGLQGGVTISGEALSLTGDPATTNNGVLSSLTGSNEWTGNITVDTGAGGSTGRAMLYAGAGSTLKVSGNINLSAGTQDFVLRGDGSGEISGTITGSQRLFKSGTTDSTGTWILSADNSSTFTGRITAGNGTLQVASENNLGATPVSFVANQLTLGGGSTNGIFKTTANMSISANRGVTLGNGGGTFNTDASTTLSVNSVVTGAGTLTKSGNGTVELGVTNTYTGLTTVAAGTLAFTNGNVSATGDQALGTNAALSLGVAATSSGTLNYTGTGAATLAKAINVLGNGSDTVQNSGTGLLTLSGTLTKNGTTLTLKGGSNGILVSGQITGAMANSDLIITGGLTTLTNATNDYNGPTTVQNTGILQVGSGGTGTTGTGAVEVQNGGQLRGTGIVQGASFSAKSGSVIHAGDGSAVTDHGALTFTPASMGAYAFDAGSTTYLDLNTTSNYDKLLFNGTSGSTLTFSGNLIVRSDGYTAQLNDSFDLLDWLIAVSADFSSFTAGTNRDGSGDNGGQFDLPDISSSGFMWDVSQFTTSGIIVVIPEPSRGLLLLFGLLGFWIRRRR